MTAISAGKVRGLTAASNEAGVFTILAVDHRDTMRAALDPDDPGGVSVPTMIETKLDLLAGIGGLASAVLLDPEYSRQETGAIQAEFRRKRRFMLDRLHSMGIAVEREPAGSFYVWADLSRLPAGLNDGIAFFERGLQRKVITVPGAFFDVNPGRRRAHARYESHTRFSFGPSHDELSRGLTALEEMIDSA